MNKNGGKGVNNDPYANQQSSNQPSRRRGGNQELSFDNESYDDEDNSMDASAFVNKHCNFAEASMMTNELVQTQGNYRSN